MARNLIGTVTTDSNGEATFTYTGGGLGRIGFSAEHGTFQSETYEILDCIFLDVATTGNKNTNWSGSPTITTGDDGTLCSNSTSSNIFYRVIEGGSLKQLSPSYAVEFDVVEYSGTVTIINDSTNNDSIRKSLGALSVSSNSHVKVTYDGDVFKYYVDDTHRTTQDITITVESTHCGFRIDPSSSLKYKNFKVYPI